MSEWVIAHDSPGHLLENLGGVPWNKAELPSWKHGCFAQTRAVIGGDRVYRCPCGAIALHDQEYWMQVNSTRLGRGEVRPRGSRWLRGRVR